MKMKMMFMHFLFCSIFIILFLLHGVYVNAGENINIYTKVEVKTNNIYQQYEVNKKYLSNLIITKLCKENGFSGVQIAIIKKSSEVFEVFEEIADEVLGKEKDRFLGELYGLLKICDKKLKEIRDNAIEDIIVSFSIEYKMSIKQIRKTIKIQGIII